MTGKQLKNAILQLAIQGKLVPQDANDEPASALLAKIRKEKEQLVKAGKLKPACRQAGKKNLETTPIADEEKPFEIPESWEWVRLGVLCSHVVDCPHSTPTKSVTPTNHPCIRTSEIKGGAIVWDSMQYLDEKNYQIRISRLKPEAGDIVYAREGVYGDAVVLPDGYEFCLGQRTMMMRMVAKEFVPYIHKAIISPFVYEQAKKLNREGTTNVGHVNMSDIVTFVIPLPPLSEQHRIVSKIEELMPLVEEYGAAQEKLNSLNEALPEALKKSILQQAIQGELVPQDANDEPASVLLSRIRKEKEKLVKAGKIALSKPEKKFKEKLEFPFEIPNSWTWCSLYDVCRVFGRIGFRGYTKEDLVKYKEDGAITISPTNIINGELDFSICTYLSEDKYNESPEIMVEVGDILLVKTASCGKTALVNELPWKTTINPQIALLKDIMINREYLSLLLKSPYIQSKIHDFTIGTSIPTFSQEIMLTLNIPLPPLAEQHRIVAKIEELMAMVDGMNN